RSAIVASTTAAGTISHTARGATSFFTKSSRALEPVAPSPTSCFTASALRSYTTHWCPPRVSRRTMLAPIRPRPIIPSCIEAWLLCEKTSAANCAFELSQSPRDVFAEVNTKQAPATLRECLKIAHRLRLDQLPERVIRFRHGQRLGWLIHELHEEACIRPTLVQLAGRVQEPRTVAERRRKTRRVSQRFLDRFEPGSRRV